MTTSNEVLQKPKEKNEFPIVEVKNISDFSYHFSHLETQNLTTSNKVQQKEKNKLPNSNIQDTAFSYDLSQFGTQNWTTTNEVQQLKKGKTSLPINENPDTVFSTDFFLNLRPEISFP